MNNAKKSNQNRYNLKKVNISTFRTIYNLIKDFPILFRELYNEIKVEVGEEIQKGRFFRRRRFTKLRKQKIKNHLKSFEDTEIEQRVMNIYNQEGKLYLEAKRISKYHVMTIRKKVTDFLPYDDLINLILDLKAGAHYIAHYGLDLTLIGHEHFEIVDLFDFNFHFENGADIRKVVRILQILDSEYYKFREFESISGRFFLYNNFEKLKQMKYLKRNKSEYIYLDSDDFEIFDRLPDFYPDYTQQILQDPRLNV